MSDFLQALTQTEAETRASLVVKNSISYKVTLNIKEGPEFLGEVTADFKLAKVTDELTIDFGGDSILSYSVN